MAQNDFSLLLSAAPDANQPVASGPDGLVDTYWQALINKESSGRQFDDSGNTITSKKGALGISQIMPTTAPEAAKLAGVEYDEQRLRNDPEYNQLLGRAYLKAKLKEFGNDPSKALAAYNGGAGAVRAAMQKAQAAGRPGSWLDYMPDETRDYVPTIMARAKPRQTERFATPGALKTERTTGEAIADTALGLGSGVVQGVGMIANAFGADNAVARGADELSKGMLAGQSDARKDQRRERSARIAAAEASGSSWREIVENVAGFAEAPIETTLTAIGTSAPTLLAALIPGLRENAAGQLILRGAIGAAQGAGSVKGTIYETVERKLIEAGYSADDAAKVAAGAQAYDSANGGNIAVGAILGKIAGLGGVEAALARRAGSKAGEQVAETAAKKGADSLAKRTVTGVVTESTPEGAQGGQERYAANVALNNEGFSVDPMQGVAGQAAGEAIASAPGGAVAGAFGAPEAVQKKAEEPNSPLSKAAVAGAAAAPATPAGPTAPGATPEDADPTLTIPGQDTVAAAAEKQAPADPLTDRVAALERQVRGGNVLEALRTEGSPVDAKRFVNDLAIARSPSTAQHLREQALSRIEFALEWVGQSEPQQAAAGSQTDAASTIDAALADPQIQLSDTDRKQLTEIRSLMGNPSLPADARAALGTQALGIVGPYMAGQSTTTNDAPAKLLDASKPSMTQAATEQPAGKPAAALLGGPIKPAAQPTVGSTQEGAAASNAAALRLQQLSEEDGQAGESQIIQTPAQAAATKAAAESAQGAAASRLDQLAQEETPEALAQETASRPEPLPVEPAQQAAIEQAFERVGEPRVAIPPDTGANETAARRKRRAVLEQLAGAGFDRVERRDDGFYFVNPRARQEFKLDGMADAQLARAAAQREMNAAAQQAATSKQNDIPQPTEAQAKAGQYAKGNLTFDGLDIAVENPVGSTRAGTAPDGTKWSVDMSAHYGFVRRTKGADGDQVDVYLPENARVGSPVYVFDQYNDDGTFDEHKVVLGVGSQADAERIYDAHFSDGSGPRRRQAVKAMTMDEFKSWLKSDRTQSQAAVEDVAQSVAPDEAPGSLIVEHEGRRLVRADESAFPADTVADPKVRGRNPVSKEQAGILRAVADVFGKKVAFFAGSNADGFVIPSQPGTIYLNEKTGISPLAVLGHELMHTLRVEVPQAYAALVKVIKGRVKDPKGFREDYSGRHVLVDEAGNKVAAYHLRADAEAALKAMDGRGMITEQSSAPLSDLELEELISDLSGNLMKDGKFWHEVFQRIQADNKKGAEGIISRLVATITNAISKIGEAFKGQRGYRANAFVDDGKEVREALRDAMARYAKSAEVNRGKLQADVLREEAKAKASPARPVAPSESPSPEVGIHFSRAERSTIDGRYYGTGLKGLEAERLAKTSDSRLKSRAYFYVDEGRGVQPEAGVGGIAHQVKLPKLYDAKADPLRLWNGADINATESRILDAGFGGYFVKQHATGQGFAVVLGDASHGMKAQRLENPSVRSKVVDMAEERVSRGLMSREMNAVDLDNIPGATMRAGILTIPANSREAANDEMARIGSPVRFSAERLETPEEQYAAVEARYRGTDQWMKAPNGEPTRLTERQWVHVRTPAFKAWFGDWEKFAGMQGGVWNDDSNSVSKAVGANGEPLVVYHGTNSAGFAEFKETGGEDRGDLGIFATPDWEGAASYVTRGRVRDVTASDIEDGEDGDIRPGVYALFMNLRNPFEANFEGANWDGQRAGQYQVVNEDGELIYSDEGRAYFHDRDEAQELADANDGATVEAAEDHYETTDSVVREARRYRHDSAIIRDVMDIGSGPIAPFDPFDIFVAADPGQVKSADFNNGAYSLDSNDIRLSEEREYKLDIQREDRVKSKAVRIGEDEMDAIKADADKLGLGRAQVAQIVQMAKDSKRQYPASEGWAPLKVIGVNVKRDDEGNPIAGSEEPKFEIISYGFNVPPGKTRAPARIDEDLVKKVATKFEGLVSDVYKRAEAGDKNAQTIIGHQTWYRNVAEVLRREYGGAGDLLADLLGATSPNTPVDTNWKFSIDIMRRFARGDFDNDLEKFDAFMKAGGNPAKYPAAAKIRQISGKLYGMNSTNAMKALLDMWRVIEPGSAPKARNFALNLIGQSNMATIDVWAARMLRRAANMVRGMDLPRIPPPAETGVSGAWNAVATSVTGEFGFGAAVMDKVSRDLEKRGIFVTPPDLQAIAWFVEKELWGKKGWTTKTGEGGSFEENIEATPVERYMAGWTIQQGERVPSDGEASLAQARVLSMLVGDDTVVAARVLPTYGLYGGTVEASFDTEWTATRGKHDPSMVIAEIARIAQENQQYDIFVSRVVRPGESNPNARPGVEIYFKSARDLNAAMPILDRFTAQGQDGFTMAVDPRAKNKTLGSQEFVGVRLQYVPEISMRWDEGLRGILAEPGELERHMEEKRKLLRDIAAEVRTMDGVAFAAMQQYDTLVVGKENYDEYIDRAAEEGRGRAGAEAWFGTPLRQGLEGAIARLNGERRQVDAGGVPAASDVHLSRERDLVPRGGRDGADRQVPAPERADAGPQGQVSLAPLPGAPAVRGFHGPDPRLVAVAEQYARDNGIELKRQAEYVKVDEDRARRIAKAYDEMAHAPNDPRVKEAYANLIRQTVAQYRALERAGYKFWFMDLSIPDNAEYASSPWNAMRDIRENKEMGVFPTEEGFGSGATDLNVDDNPLLADTGIRWPTGSLGGKPKRVLANDLFRAVHDAFGHGLEGSGFRAQGEENAWQAHVRLFTGSAVGAITTETRGQNSWLNYGPYGEKNRTAAVEDTVFADQKTGLMPEWTWTEGRVGDEPTPPRGGKIRASTERAPAFYSQLQRAIEQVPSRLSTMAAPQWAQWLKANAPKLGVKQDEITWSGIEEYLKLRGKDKIAGTELAEWLGGNGVRVQETVLSVDGGDEARRIRSQDSPRVDEIDGRFYIVGDDGDPIGDGFDSERGAEAALDAALGGAVGESRYASYTVPGGENYREVLITLPSVGDEDGPAARRLRAATTEEEYNAARREIDEARERQYKSSHWDQPNILAHLRVDDRTDADGNKVLFVNEIQSDWAQDGRKNGFNNNDLPPGYEVRKISVRNPLAGLGGNSAVEAERYAVFDSSGNKVTRDFQTEGGALSAFLADRSKVPLAPFVTDTKAWVAMALKRAIMMAVEGGYDRVAMITGNQAADLYDLSKQVDMLSMDPAPGGYNITAWRNDEEVASRTVRDEAEAADMIGKEPASKLFARKDDGHVELTGVDLKVGGEGMRAFYDQIVPQVARDVLKKLGGDGLRTVSIVSENKFSRSEQDRFYEQNGYYHEEGRVELDQPGFDITDKMRESVAAGVPLFSRERAQDVEQDAEQYNQRVQALRDLIACLSK